MTFHLYLGLSREVREEAGSGHILSCLLHACQVAAPLLVSSQTIPLRIKNQYTDLSFTPRQVKMGLVASL